MANWAIFNTAIGQQFWWINKKSNTLINVNDWNKIDTEVTQKEPTQEEVAKATPQFRIEKEKALNDQLRNKWYVIPQTPKSEQNKYWSSLPNEAQTQMKQYHDMWYSFDWARALIEQQYGKNPQSLKVQRAWQAKGSDTWIGAVQDSFLLKALDRINLPWKLTEWLMSTEQNLTDKAKSWVNEKVWAREGSTLFRDRANKNLKEKIDALPESKVKELTDEYNEDSRRWKMRRNAYGSVENYIEEKTKSWWEEILGIGTIEWDPYPGMQWDRIIANAPKSAADLATASIYAMTNPFDNLSDLAYLFTTKEWLEIVMEQYGWLDKIQETIQSDPFWFISDLMDAKNLIARAKTRQKGIQSRMTQSQINAKGNEILKLASDIAKEQEKAEWWTTVETLDKMWELDTKIQEKKWLEEKKKEQDESAKKWSERAEQANSLSDFIPNTEPINKAIINYLASKWWIGKSLAYWYSLTQSPLQTVWNWVATERTTEQWPNTQTLEDLDEWKGQETTQVTVRTPIAWWLSDSKIVKNVGEVWKRIRDKWEERTTGLTPDMKARIQQNPYVQEYWWQVKATIEDEGLSNQEQIIEEQFLEEIGNELLARIENEESRVEETGIMYNKIRELPQTFDFTPTSEWIIKLFDRAGITIRPDGSLFFRSWSEAMTTDRSHAQILWNLMLQIMNGKALTASQYLDLRSQLKAIEKYKKGMDPTSAGKAAMLARQLRHEINKVAHKEIPGLKEIDAQYSEQISYLQQLKKDITYAQWPNSWKVRSNFYSIIRNINSANRKQYAGIIAWIFPEVKDRVEAARLMPKLIKAYQKNSWLLQSVVNMPKLLSAAQLASGDWFIKSAMTLLIGQFVEEWLIRPVDKKLRQATIDQVIWTLDPIAKLKLEEALKNAQDWEKLTAEEQMVLQEVTKKIAQSIEEYRENLPKLPSPAPDVISEDWTITLWRWEPNTPEPQRRSIIEINLSKPEAKTKQIKAIQEAENVDQQTAEKIQDSIESFIQMMWWEDWKVTTEEVDYSNFSTPTLNELRVDERIPQIEKDKIAEILKNRTDYVEESEWEEMDKYFAAKINNLEAEEQRIGKVGKNKVSKTVADQQARNLEKKKERILKEMEQFYKIDTNEAYDKYAELRDKPLEFIESYKKSNKYIYESAEREVLNRLLSEWEKQPKFTRSFNQKQLDARSEIINNAELQWWYEIETTDYNDRYVLKIDWQIVDRWAIRYNPNWVAEIIAQDMNWLLDSWLLETVPEDTIVRLSESDIQTTAWELKWERYQMAPQTNEDLITRDEWLNLTNVVNWKSVNELLKWYWIRVQWMPEINVWRLRKAYWKYRDWLITLADSIKESTAPHELLHAVFDLVDEKIKQDILNRIMNSEWVDRIAAEEILADNFSQYFRTWEFDNYIAPKSFIDKIKAFFKKVKQFITGVYDNQTVMKKLFDDIIEGKVENTWFTDRVKYSATKGSTEQPPVQNNWNSRRIRVWWSNSSPSATFSSNANSIRIWNKTYSYKGKAPKFSNDYIFPLDPQTQTFVDNFNDWIKNGARWVVIWEYDGYEIRLPFNEDFWYHIDRHWMFDPENLVATINDFDTLKVHPDSWRYIFEKQLPNGNWLRAIATQNFKHVSFYETNNPWKWWPIIDTNWGNKYQITQESLFAEPKKQFTEKEMNDAFDKHRPKLEAVIDRIWTNKNRNIDYPPIRIAYSILESYSPDVNKWIENINHDITLTKRKWITPGELTWIYHALEQFMKDPEMKAWVEYNNNNNGHLWKQLFDMMKNMENNPLEIPEEYKMSDSLQKLNDTLYDNLERATINNLIWTYDPDPIEWKYNVNKALKDTTSEYLTLSKLYNIKNMVQDYINESWDKPVAWTFDDVWIQKLVDLEKKWKEQKVSTFDNEQITKVWEELWEQLVKFNQDTIDVLWDMYNSDVDKWQSNLEKVKSIRKQYSDIRVPHTNTLTTLKSKLMELSKYSPEEIREVFWEDDQASKNLYKFVKEVRDKEAKLEAEWTTKAVTDLVALHNMDLKNFERQIKNFNGKSPMPSIAVMDPNVPHEVFGDLTLIFWKDTINPKVDERNKIYGSDAWTPMFPDIEEAWTLSTYAKRHQAIMEIIRPNKEWLESEWVKRPENFRFDFNQATEECLKDYSWRKDLNENADMLAEQIMEDIVVELGHSQAEFLEWDIELYERIEDWFYKMFTNASTSEYVIPGRYFEDGVDRPLTPENVVEAMKNQRVNREVQPWSFRDMIEIEWHELNDVEDVRRQNFAKVFHWDWTGDLWNLEHRYDSLIKLIAEDNNRLDWNTQDDNNVVEDIKYEIKNAYDPDVTKFREKLNEAYPDTPLEDWTVWKPIFREDILQRIIDVVEQGKKIPIRFSESKPERVVDLYKEVQYVLVPSNDLKKAQQIVKGTELEWKLVEYTPDNHTAPRSRKIKELQKRYWNIFFQMWWVVMPIAMLLKMAETLWWGWDDDQEES